VTGRDRQLGLVIGQVLCCKQVAATPRMANGAILANQEKNRVTEFFSGIRPERVGLVLRGWSRFARCLPDDEDHGRIARPGELPLRVAPAPCSVEYPMKKVLAALVLAAAIVTTAVGCGGGSPTKGTSTSTTTATKAS
jgi:hypothetical protein